MSQDKIELFVPGRLCLLGEHSDWAGMHRVMNSAIVPGYAIVSGLEQGIYATAEKCDKFVVESDLEIYRQEVLECEMDTEKLIEIAKEGGFFSYVAGVASYINENYSVGGVRIRITRMDLPMKSGLSSSAAICVLVARAFNQLYHLRLNTNGEMLAAFRGEQRTPSRCGRLDQACAFGTKPVFMKFDGTEVNARSIQIGTTFYWVVADLKASKDTVKILSDLNRCYPFAQNEKDCLVQEALGEDNEQFVSRAVQYLEKGDAKGLGELMVEFQKNFDKKIAPACPEQLAAPILHSVLNDNKIKHWTYGAKGVGSQGDGTVQFLAKDEESRDALIAYLREEKGMPAFSLTLKPEKRIKRAIIPIAGFGTRLYPATRGIKKAFMPLVDKDGLLKPALLILLEQLDEAGIEDVCLVIGPDEQAEYENFFRPMAEEHIQKLSSEKREYEEKIVRIGKRIIYVCQKERLGFGHAVYQCKEFTKGEPVLLLLGDMVYKSFEEKNCMEQMVDAYEKYGKTMVSIHKIPVEEAEHYGILYGQWEDKQETLMKVECMKEKPGLDYANEYLKVHSAKKGDGCYAVFGQYILTSAVFEELRKNIEAGSYSKGEIQLTDALEAVREKEGMYAYEINGKSFDTGLPEIYRQTFWEFGK